MAGEKTNAENQQHSDAYLIEKERQKTRRSRNRYIFFVILAVAALLTLYFIVGKGGKGGFEMNLTEGTFKFNVDKPVTEQMKTATKSFQTSGGKQIDYTTGTVSADIIDQFEVNDITFSPYMFSGENLVNSEAGYLISSSAPDLWTVQYNPAGLYDPLTPVHTLMASDGSNLNITMEAVSFPNIEDYIQESINNLIAYGFITEYPYVSYADDGRTAFLTFTNYTSNGQSYMKVIKGNSYYYIATANYNLSYSDQYVTDELIWMVANFTLIE